MKRHWIITFCISVVVPIFAVPSHVHFQRYSTEDGLSQSTVRCFAQDNNGFIWVGTQDGLNRFDGYAFQTYRHIPDDSSSLLSNDIYSLYKDREGRLWVGTNLSLCIYDQNLDRFEQLLTHDYIQDGTAGLTVRAIFEDHLGNMWIGCDGGGVFFFAKGSKQYIQYIHNPDNPSSLSGDNVWSITEDHEGNIWIGTRSGLNRFDAKSNGFIRYYANSDASHHLSYDEVSSLFVDEEGTLWIATYGGGLNRYDAFRDRFVSYTTENSELKTNILYQVFEDSQNTLWVATDGEGLYAFDRVNNTFVRFSHTETDLRSLSNDKVVTVFEDEQTNLWVGNFQGGINFTSFISRKAFFTVQYQAGVQNTLSHPIVTAVLKDRFGDIWVGTDGGGLNRILKNDGRIVYYKHNPENSGSLPHDAVLSLFEDHEGVLWIGTYLGGLSRFVRETSRFVTYQYQPDNPHSLSNNDVRNIIEDNEHRLWISTNGGGVSVLDAERKNFTRYKRELQNPDESLALDWVRPICQDSRGTLWIGTYSGLSRFDETTQAFRNFRQSANPRSISSNTILSIHEDRNNRLWIGTDRGLNLYQEQSEDFDLFSRVQGLPSDVINGILEDEHGNLWLTTNNGLSRFSTPGGMMSQKGTLFRNFNVSDGLQGNAFNNGAAFQDKDGIFYVGGTNGLTFFHPDSIYDNPYLPTVVITDFQLFNQPVPIGPDENGRTLLKKCIMETDTLILGHQDDVFSFEFAALHFVAPDNNHYAYQMVGFDKHWVHTTASKRFATYTNMDPGEYVFQVKASNNDGVWNPQVKSLFIVIRPPFWETWWFRILIGLLVIGLINLWAWIRIWRLRAHRIELQKQVAERTQELKSKTDELEKSNKLLKKEIREHQLTEAKLAESNRELEQFAYVASHDLQEPLRMVSSYLSLLLRRNQDSLDQDSKEFIGFAVDGAKRMQVMIQDLLMYSRVKTQAKPFESCSCNDLIERVLHNLKISIEECGAKVTHGDLPVVQVDVGQFERLLLNLVGNAIKYRDKDTVPEVHISAELKDGNWIFCISDNGIGIDPKHQDRIFGIFQRLHGRNEYSGTGIGLAICKRIVERHNGKIWVESEEGQGARFYFTIPEQN